MKKLAPVLRYIIAAVAFVLVVSGLTMLFRYINEHNDSQRTAEIALEDYIGTDKEFPVGKFVSVEARWVLGPFAEETSTTSSYGIETTSGVCEYYFLVLEDMSVMAIKTQNLQEIETLNRMSEWLMKRIGYPKTGETIRLQGKLTKLTNSQLLSFYREDAADAFRLSATDPALRALVLDTTAGRESVYIYLGVAWMALLFGGLVWRHSKKKRQAAQERAALQSAFDSTPEQPDGTAGF